MNLYDTLRLIAPLFEVPANALYDYALEDTIGGYHEDKSQARWPMGSLWEVEGQTLYTLIRVLKPRRLAELGCFYGCSTTHIRAALEDNGGKWDLTCVDLSSNAGSLIPPRYKVGINWRIMDIDHFIEENLAPFDFIFLDGNHSSEQSRHVWTRAQSLLAPGGVMVEHDALHFLVGAPIRQGIHAAGVNPVYVKSEPSDCGLAIWRKPGVTVQEADALLYGEVEDVDWLADEDGEKTALEIMSYAELKAMARKQGIVVRGKMKRETLIERLREAK